jgi:hypothetical protein
VVLSGLLSLLSVLLGLQYLMINTLEHYQQTYTYDTGNNLTALSHQENSNNWQQIAKCIVVVPM